MIALIPILIMSVLFGMKIGAIAGFGISSAMSVINLISNLPEFDLMKAIVIAILTGIGGGMYGWLSDQRKFLLESERKFEEMIIKKEEKVIKTTQKLTHLVETLNDEIQMRRTVVKSAASREARMADLKMVIKKLRHQLEEAGVEPVADDPLNE